MTLDEVLQVDKLALREIGQARLACRARCCMFAEWCVSCHASGRLASFA
ncbi:MAG TPA: hypothetical protein VKV24_03450 [Casimicrobiaceae bacterium]|nr:hypothetical protein [Casimicrobiaceae bacterium]